MEYGSTERVSPGFESIDKVPIYLLIAGSDELCPASSATDILYQEIQS